MEIRNNHGGRRPGAGRKPLKNKKIGVTLSVSPEVIIAFKKKWGRGWAQKVEDYMLSEIKDVS